MQDMVYPPDPDIISFMYPTPAFCREFLAANRADKRPVLLCEYAHAMGNSGGGTAEYQALFESDPRFMGGFLWEWRDHGVQTAKGLCYGGDFGESMHDGSFCIDGLLDADHRPHTSLMEAKAVFAPFIIDEKNVSTGDFYITNLQDFSFLSRFECRYEVTRYGKVVEKDVKQSELDKIRIARARELEAQLYSSADDEPEETAAPKTKKK